MEAVKAGAGRETAHEAIKEHALAAAKAIRNGTEADRVGRPSGDKFLGLKREKLKKFFRTVHALSVPLRSRSTNLSRPSRRSLKAPPATSRESCCNPNLTDLAQNREIWVCHRWDGAASFVLHVTLNLISQHCHG